MQDLGVNGRIVGGSIKFKGREMNTMTREELRDIRGSEIAMIYQEPMASLNPAMRIGKQLMEVPMIHEGVSKDVAYASNAGMGAWEWQIWRASFKGAEPAGLVGTPENGEYEAASSRAGRYAA
mgnify:CR=1 FL=1